ncbi:MAG: LLM class flavin-dependent oxidoreductase, partial [Gammaproteobacteria bacterium]|nr:LLM class flavin-dependent oxidoreductase [Gammaproteobacteria bacterium]
INWPDEEVGGRRLGGFHADPWITLGLIAARTSRVLIGTAVTPIARRRPTKLAREILTLHQLSGGRFVLGAGSGAWPTEFDDFGDPSELKVRAEML